ncbi:hypothetical protein EVAR_53396_1 [Eumeta japonica]|uniref:Uncharacterized protein n=1 Tax=Eumeta variegata TaxID=151549 RepID=A0A4C1Y5E2_EUMVA|nr:hypothetical protein EVAR_53396_1 [Eumeta japonica]
MRPRRRRGKWPGLIARIHLNLFSYGPVQVTVGRESYCVSHPAAAGAIDVKRAKYCRNPERDWAASIRLGFGFHCDAHAPPRVVRLCYYHLQRDNVGTAQRVDSVNSKPFGRYRYEIKMAVRVERFPRGPFPAV